MTQCPSHKELMHSCPDLGIHERNLPRILDRPVGIRFSGSDPSGGPPMSGVETRRRARRELPAKYHESMNFPGIRNVAIRTFFRGCRPMRHRCVARQFRVLMGMSDHSFTRGNHDRESRHTCRQSAPSVRWRSRRRPAPVPGRSPRPRKRRRSRNTQTRQERRTLVYISAALSVIGLILGLFTLTGSQEYKDLQDQGQGAYAWGVFAGAAFFALIKVVLQILSARAATKGKNWGRIVLIVLAVLSLLGLLAPSADVSGILSIISTLLLVIGTIMMLTGRGGAWFKEIKQRRQQNMMR